MKAVAIKELNQELLDRSPRELREICLRLARFKKENKELLTYLLFESSDEAQYVQAVKSEIDRQLTEVNKKSYYFIKKSLRKILTNTRKYIRYSQNKKTEVDLLIYYCVSLRQFTPSINNYTALRNIYARQIETIREKIGSLHEDLQFDYAPELEMLIS
jgi:hypothetical protein